VGGTNGYRLPRHSSCSVACGFGMPWIGTLFVMWFIESRLNRALPSRSGLCVEFESWVQVCIVGSSDRLPKPSWEPE
jgi:hypothetical protein